MKIETKFNPKEEVFINLNTKLIKAEIDSVKIECTETIRIMYWFKIPKDIDDYDFKSVEEKFVFKTKQDFIDQL